ncbi:hypothetical protein LMH87_001448 [Akanthomyces muscarius]|uniref:Uncharacterized protein n=1 Tax=Akanthomyces muscarius TaxID=2231603 RepID=A0A9W8UIE9_AKAMU|nr:hypothetical protein LMH87_001448 [Akanthomyces muscarius]KAJ4146889.1 hypothetical protein LMH87_001448 [Akanthomyces muscarius]
MPWHCPFPKTYDGLDGRYYYHEDPYKWPYFKFGEALKPEDIFGHLHERFNTAPIAIMDKVAWHADVVDLITMSKTLDEFYARLEERKMLRLDELKSAIASADVLDSVLFKWGTPLYLLCRAMQKLHDSASVFDAASAFVAMQNFVKEQSEQHERALKRQFEVERGEARTHSLDITLKTGDGPDTISADVAQETRANPRSPPDVTPPPTLQSHSKPPSSSQRLRPGTNKTTNNRKRKQNAVEGVTGPTKKPRATLPASRRSSYPGRRSPAGNDTIPAEDGREDEATSSSHQKESSQRTSFDQKQPMPDTDKQETLSESLPDTGQDVSTVVKATESPGAGSPCAAQSPRSNHPDHGQTRYYSNKINYEHLGWQRDFGPSDKALPSGEQRDEADTSEIGSGLHRPRLEPGAKLHSNSGPAAGF